MMARKIALITGSSSGIGFQTALLFARNGYITYASVRNKSKGLELQALAKKEQLDIHIIEIDVASERSVVRSVKQIQEEENSIDVLVNNAGFGFYGPIESFTIDEVQDQFDVNIFGALRLIKQVVPIMRQQKSGYIINVSSINGLVTFPFLGVYAASKFAIESYSEALRFELMPFGIRVALVEPGTFLTNFSRNKKTPKSLENVDSPYAEKAKDFFEMLSNKERQLASGRFKNFFDPKKVADKIFLISNQNSPSLHNLIGIDAFIYYYGKKIMPESIWNFFLHKVYNY